MTKKPGPRRRKMKVWDVVQDDLEEVAKSWRRLRRPAARIKEAFENRKPGDSVKVDQELLEAVSDLSTTIRDCPTINVGPRGSLMKPCLKPVSGPRGTTRSIC